MNTNASATKPTLEAIAGAAPRLARGSRRRAPQRSPTRAASSPAGSAAASKSRSTGARSTTAPSSRSGSPRPRRHSRTPSPATGPSMPSTTPSPIYRSRRTTDSQEIDSGHPTGFRFASGRRHRGSSRQTLRTMREDDRLSERPPAPGRGRVASSRRGAEGRSRGNFPPMPNRLAARDEPVPPPARREPGRLVPVGRGGASRRPATRTSRSCSRSATRPATGAT